MSGRLGQYAAGLHLGDALLEGPGHVVDVGIGVSGCEETREAFLNVNALLPQMVVKQAAEPLVRWKAEVEDRPEMFDARRDAALREVVVESLDEARGFLVQSPLEAGPLSFRWLRTASAAAARADGGRTCRRRR